jgi:transcriptional regulator with XRE-family HTH domain
MIGTQREFAAAKRDISAVEAALRQLDKSGGKGHPIVAAALREGYTGELKRLRSEIADFEAIRSGAVREISVSSLEQLAEAVVLARTAAGKTQKQVAEDLGVAPQQIQRDEATRYARAGIDRLAAVMGALNLEFEGRIVLRAESQDVKVQMTDDQTIQAPVAVDSDLFAASYT